MRLVGLDLGQKRIGVAVAESERGLAFPERVLRRTSARADRQAIVTLVTGLRAERVILGLPLTAAGERGENAERAEAFGRDLARALPVPLEMQDERFSTIEADERLAASGAGWRERKRRVDAAAAAVILEDYLRAHAV
ncbi:MAG TPA: Holliday junction resolvase RuvX [Chloroflexota bacterium]|nr:Holliday junction resolvase RuvX [Chloroflexota bacterium]